MSLDLDFDVKRRALVLGSAAAVGLGATGCSSMRPTPRIPGECKARPLPFLAGPEVLAAWARPERHFDAHTHFFNARDVPVRQYLAKSVAHDIEDKALRELVIALAPIAEWLGKTAISPKDEFDELCRMPETRTMSAAQQSAELDKTIDDQRDRLAEDLYREILKRGRQIPQLIDEAVDKARGRNRTFLAGRPTSFSLDFVRDSLRDGGNSRDPSTGRIAPQRVSPLSTQESRAMSMRGVLQFVGFMLSRRHHNLRSYIRKFSEGSPSLPLSGCFAAPVDFNYWLDSPAKASNLEDQVRLHSMLSLLSNGFLLPLVPYNPWVDIKEEDASIRLVEKAVDEFGCVGVKIYPPMGYYPYGNPGSMLDSPEPRPKDLALLDAKLAALYQLCDSMKVPVMAHGNDSGGRDAAHDELAGPTGWAALQRKVPALTRLFVNVGHFGGEHEHPSGDWTDGFVELMKREGRLRIYGDLGHWNELAAGSTKVVEKLARVLATRLPGNETVADRVMYGSDWTILSREPDWQSYPDAIAAIVRGMGPPQATPKVFGDNVLNCYGLSKASDRGRLSKLVEFHAQRGSGSGPGWMRV